MISPESESFARSPHPHLPYRGVLNVTCLSAKDLPNHRDLLKLKSIDPYLLVTLGSQSAKTQAIKRGGSSPEWNQKFTFQVYPGSCLNANDAQSQSPPLTLDLRVLDKDLWTHDDMIGQGVLTLDGVFEGHEFDGWVPLMKGRTNDVHAGAVRVRVAFIPADLGAYASPTNDPVPEQVGGLLCGGHAAGRASSRQLTLLHHQHPSHH